jgi:Protein of unknown function (DUF2971)
MAVVRPPDVPARLFRYCRLDRDDDIEHETEAAIMRYIHCSMYKRLNDPMEGFYEPSIRLKKEPLWRSTYRELLNAKQTVGIACFSETFDNEIMWAHYAGNCAGMCVAYSSAKLLAGLSPSARLAKIAYADSPLRLSKRDKLDDIYAAAQKILSHKKYNWAYEREWRVLADYVGQQPFTGDVVTDVYFGSLTTLANKQLIKNAFAGRSVRFYAMKVTGYRHRWMKA